MVALRFPRLGKTEIKTIDRVWFGIALRGMKVHIDFT